MVVPEWKRLAVKGSRISLGIGKYNLDENNPEEQEVTEDENTRDNRQ